MAKVIEGLYYSESHEYVRVEGDTMVSSVSQIMHRMPLAMWCMWICLKWTMKWKQARSLVL